MTRPTVARPALRQDSGHAHSQVQHRTGHFKGNDGTKLFWQDWSVPKPRAILLLVHGLGEHSGRYQFPVDYFTERGYSLVAYDHRGHGRSEGTRVYAERFDDFVDDLEIFWERVKEESHRRPIFLVAHSFGGQVALNFVARQRELINGSCTGVIVSSPNIRVKIPLPSYKLWAAQLLNAFVPRVAIGNEIDARLVSHDPLVVRDYRSDPLVERRVTLRLACEVLDNQKRLEKLAHRVELPCFLMHAGADQICCPEATQKFYEKIPIKDKKLKIYEGFYHELFNEVQRQTVFQDMEKWIEKHL